MINLNALLRRPVEYYEYPWALESALRSAQAMVRSLFQPPDITFVFSKSMPRSGHRFLSECLTHYFGPKLHYCGFYRPDCCHRIPCARPHNEQRRQPLLPAKEPRFRLSRRDRPQRQISRSSFARRSRGSSRTTTCRSRVASAKRARRRSPPSPRRRPPTSSISTGNGWRPGAPTRSPSPMRI